jgi:hypothetical protein
MSLSRYACSSCDDHWPCNGFTASTVPATGLRAVCVRSAYLYLMFLLVIPARRSAARYSIGKLYRQPTFDAGSPRFCPWSSSPLLLRKGTYPRGCRLTTLGVSGLGWLQQISHLPGNLDKFLRLRALRQPERIWPRCPGLRRHEAYPRLPKKGPYPAAPR